MTNHFESLIQSKDKKIEELNELVHFYNTEISQYKKKVEEVTIELNKKKDIIKYIDASEINIFDDIYISTNIEKRLQRFNEEIKKVHFGCTFSYKIAIDPTLRR